MIQIQIRKNNTIYEMLIMLIIIMNVLLLVIPTDIVMYNNYLIGTDKLTDVL